jgi:Helix-turn-helix domain
MTNNGFTKFPNRLWGTNLSPGAKLTYAAIASFAYGAKTTAWPGQETLALMTGFSARSIRRFTAELEKAELVRVERRTWGVNRYHLKGAEPVATESANMSSDTGQDVPPRQDTVSAKEDNSNKSRENNTERRSSEDTMSGVEKQVSQVRNQTNEESNDSKLPSSNEAVTQSEPSETEATRLQRLRLHSWSRDLTDEELLAYPHDPEDRQAYAEWLRKVWRRKQSEMSVKQDAAS